MSKKATKKVTEIKSKVKVVKDPKKEIQELAETVISADPDISEEDQIEFDPSTMQETSPPQRRQSLASLVRSDSSDLGSTSRNQEESSDRDEENDEDKPQVSYDGSRSSSSSEVNYSANNAKPSGKHTYAASSDNYNAGNNAEKYDDGVGRDDDRDINQESSRDMFNQRDSKMQDNYSTGVIGDDKKKKREVY